MNTKIIIITAIIVFLVLTYSVFKLSMVSIKTDEPVQVFQVEIEESTTTPEIKSVQNRHLLAPTVPPPTASSQAVDDSVSK